MGAIVKGLCSCGYESRELDIGGGMMPGSGDRVPVCCPDCSSMWAADASRASHPCRRCRGETYRLHEAGNFAPADCLTRFRVSYPWDLDCTELDDEETGPVPDVRYRCPDCGKIEMDLAEYGCWD